jgi:hypothetical protein
VRPQVEARVDVLRRLWPMISLLQSPTDRTAAFVAAWRTALGMHLQAAEAAAKGARARARMGAQGPTAFADRLRCPTSRRICSDRRPQTPRRKASPPHAPMLHPILFRPRRQRVA